MIDWVVVMVCWFCVIVLCYCDKVVWLGEVGFSRFRWCVRLLLIRCLFLVMICCVVFRGVLVMIGFWLFFSKEVRCLRMVLIVL